MEETKRIKLRVRARQTSDGRKFLTYKTVTKNGRLIDCKFRKEVTNIPAADCYIICNINDMNMQRNSEYPVLWVSAIQSVEQIGTSTAEQLAKNAEQINEMF